MQLKLAGIAQFSCLLALAAGIYALKSQADAKGDALRKLESQINSDRAAIRMLEAEIAYHAQFNRVEAAATTMQLVPVAASQIAQVSDIERLAPLVAPAGESAPVAVATAQPEPAAPEIPAVIGAR
jgi:hypothetical protein